MQLLELIAEAAADGTPPCVQKLFAKTFTDQK